MGIRTEAAPTKGQPRRWFGKRGIDEPKRSEQPAPKALHTRSLLSTNGWYLPSPYSSRNDPWGFLTMNGAVWVWSLMNVSPPRGQSFTPEPQAARLLTFDTRQQLWRGSTLIPVVPGWWIEDANTSQYIRPVAARLVLGSGAEIHLSNYADSLSLSHEGFCLDFAKDSDISQSFVVVDLVKKSAAKLAVGAN